LAVRRRDPTVCQAYADGDSLVASAIIACIARPQGSRRTLKASCRNQQQWPHEIIGLPAAAPTRWYVRYRLASPRIATDTGGSGEQSATGGYGHTRDLSAREATMKEKRRHRCGSQRVWPIKNPTLRLKT